MMRFLPWIVSAVALLGSHYAAYHIGVTTAETRMIERAYDAEDAHRRATDSLRLAVRQATAQVDTITRTVTRRILAVDTAWLAVPESIFVQVPAVADARSACVALSETCAEAQQLYAYERAARAALQDTTRLQLARAEQRARDAEARARKASDQAWRRRTEGAIGVLLVGVGIEYLRGRP